MSAPTTAQWSSSIPSSPGLDVLIETEASACRVEDLVDGVAVECVAHGASASAVLGDVAGDVAVGFELAEDFAQSGGVEIPVAGGEGVADVFVIDRVVVFGEDREHAEALFSAGEVAELDDPFVGGRHRRLSWGRGCHNLKRG